MSAAQKSSTKPRDQVHEFRNWLATLDKPDLEAVLSNRPDTAIPVPPDINALATRMLLPGSIAMALAGCTAAELAVIEALSRKGAELEPVKASEIAPLLPFAPKEAIGSLRSRALIFDITSTEASSEQGFCLLPRVVQALPSGLMLLEQPEVSAEEVRALSADKREVLATIARAGGSIVTVGANSPIADSTALKDLLAQGLVIEDGSHTIKMPRTTLQAIKGQQPVIVPLQAPAQLRFESEEDASGAAQDEAAEQETKADQSGTAAGLDVVYAMDRVIDALARKPQALLKNKSLGIRQLTQVAREINREDKETKALLALGMSARLLGRGEPEGLEGNFLAPTMQAMEWMDSPLDERWKVLLEGWERMDAAYWESQRGLDPEVENPRLPELRALIVHTFNTANAPLEKDGFWQAFAYLHPLTILHTNRDTLAHLLQEVQWIGAIARGRATAVVRESFEATGSLCPEPIEQFIIQADHTVMAPGPLTPAVQRILSSFATLESPGLASVYRFDHASIRRGLDSALTGAEMKDFLSAHTWGEVPQAIAVLIDDVARSHGTLRSSAVRCYVRSDDTTLLTQAAATVPELRVIAPTVAVSSLPLSEVLEQLRAQGFSPAAEDESGVSIDVRPEPALVPAAKPAKASRDGAGRANTRAAGEDHVERAVAHLISKSHKQPEKLAVSAEDFTAVLRAAARSSHPVKITYANKHGEPTTVGATPLRVDGGQVDALVGTNTVRFPLHRISAVVMD
ncbi:helicase-associated domain-containing protein [Corynebacterium sp.]|uniref:helicase-associated domain-containing protein n=1 Tax=Corynebacterium sp. TaxID=1720 RepID=UPI0028AA68E4|nr:helicase-associated domain-containing protein [Corynebacterium sp.]